MDMRVVLALHERLELQIKFERDAAEKRRKEAEAALRSRRARARRR